MSAIRCHFYETCGLSIASDAPLAGLRPASATVDVDVRISMRGATAPTGEDLRYPRTWWVSPEMDAGGQPDLRIDAGECGFRLRYGDVATFLVDQQGRHVVAQWAASCSDVGVASYFTGSVLAFVLRVRGSIPLHASAVAIEDQAMLFVGDSWSGKSSTAAAFATLGFPLLSDDIVRLDAVGDGLVAYPSPRLNLWGDSAATLFGSADRDAYRKREIDAREAGYRFQAAAVPIEAVYVLAERVAGLRRPAVRDLRPREALMRLVRHTFGGCWLDKEMRAREFDVLARLIERAPVRELAFGDVLEDLASSCRTLAENRSPADSERPALEMP